MPALDPTGVLSTISKLIITGLLRGELPFQGLISTEAMEMAGLAAQYTPGEAAVRALKAGGTCC